MALNREQRRRLQKNRRPGNDSLRAEFADRLPQQSRTGGSSSPEGSSGTTYLIEMEDGYLVRVPEDRLESWEKAQREHGNDPLTPEEQQLVERLWQRVYGPKE